MVQTYFEADSELTLPPSSGTDQQWFFDGAFGMAEGRRFDVATPNNLVPTSLSLLGAGATDTTADGVWKANTDGTVSFTPFLWWGGETEASRTAVHIVTGQDSNSNFYSFTCTAIFDPFYWDGYAPYGTAPAATTTVAMSGLAAAVSAAAAGDVIHVTDSNVAGTVSLTGSSGTLGNEIEIWAVNDKGAQCDRLDVNTNHLKIHGLRMNGAGHTSHALRIITATNIQFHRCFFSNPNLGGTPVASGIAGAIIAVGTVAEGSYSSVFDLVFDSCEVYYGRQDHGSTNYRGNVFFEWVKGLTVTNSKIWRLVKGRGITLLDCEDVLWERCWHEDNASWAFRVWGCGDNIKINWNRSKDCGQQKENTAHQHQSHFQFAECHGSGPESGSGGTTGTEMIGNTCWMSNPKSADKTNIPMKPVQTTSHTGDVGGPYNGTSGTCSDVLSLYRSWGTITVPIKVQYNRCINGGPGLQISGSTGISETVVNQVGITIGDQGGGYVDCMDNVFFGCPRNICSVYGGHKMNLYRNRGTMYGDWAASPGGTPTPQGPDFYISSRQCSSFAINEGGGAVPQTPDHSDCDAQDNISFCYYEHPAYDSNPDQTSGNRRVPWMFTPQPQFDIRLGQQDLKPFNSDGPLDPEDATLVGATNGFDATVYAGMKTFLWLKW